MERNVRQHNTRVMQPRNLVHVPLNITHHLPGMTEKEKQARKDLTAKKVSKRYRESLTEAEREIRQKKEGY